VILPGNHDPVAADSVYARGGFAAIPNLGILGMTHDRAISFPASPHYPPAPADCRRPARA